MHRETFYIPVNDGLGFGALLECARKESRLVYVSHLITDQFSAPQESNGSNVIAMTLLPHSMFADSRLLLPSPEQAIRFLIHAGRACDTRPILFPHPPVTVNGKSYCLLRTGFQSPKSTTVDQRLFAVPVSWEPTEDVWVAGVVKR